MSKLPQLKEIQRRVDARERQWFQNRRQLLQRMNWLTGELASVQKQMEANDVEGYIAKDRKAAVQEFVMYHQAKPTPEFDMEEVSEELDTIVENVRERRRALFDMLKMEYEGEHDVSKLPPVVQSQVAQMRVDVRRLLVRADLLLLKIATSYAVIRQADLEMYTNQALLDMRRVYDAHVEELRNTVQGARDMTFNATPNAKKGGQEDIVACLDYAIGKFTTKRYSTDLQFTQYMSSKINLQLRANEAGSNLNKPDE